MQPHSLLGKEMQDLNSPGLEDLVVKNINSAPLSLGAVFPTLLAHMSHSSL